ncbi:MAG: hypothetical protein H9W81_07385 [Enterococcus sp.]|nr:hypothetical protein [Enterococcus sp.]
MEIALILLAAVFIIVFLIVIGAYLADRKLRNIDKEKYYDKSLKKQLKRGVITDFEYETKNKMIRP